MGPVIASIHDKRAALQEMIKAMAPDVEVRQLGRRGGDHSRAAPARSLRQPALPGSTPPPKSPHSPPQSRGD
jgi:hypothetical protein